MEEEKKEEKKEGEEENRAQVEKLIMTFSIGSRKQNAMRSKAA